MDDNDSQVTKSFAGGRGGAFRSITGEVRESDERFTIGMAGLEKSNIEVNPRKSVINPDSSDEETKVVVDQ